MLATIDATRLMKTVSNLFDSRLARRALLGLWALAVLTGLALLTEFDTSSGALGSAPQAWPDGARANLDRARPTLLMFVHPKCPCTGASIEELKQIVAAHPGAANVQVLFRVLEVETADWMQTPLWEEAAAVPQARLASDPNGAEAARFGARTSGHVLLFDASGTLLFSGGITPARGHAGDNPGRSALAALLAGKAAPVARNRVFGCPLFNPIEGCASRTACPSK